MRWIVILAAALIFLSACTNEELTKETLEKAGYSNIETGEYDMFGCSDDDWYATRFTADNHLGMRIEGTVCCGMFLKRCTIRY